MIPEIGVFSLVLALLLAVAQGTLALAGAHWDVATWMRTARRAALGQFLFGGPFMWVLMLAPLGMVLVLSFGIQRLAAGTALALFYLYAGILGVSLATIFIALVLTYFLSQIIGDTFFVIDGLTDGVATGNPMMFIGFVIYGLLSVLVLFIFIRFLASWFVFTRNTFLGFVMKVTNPIMIPVQKLIPPIGMFDLSAMIVLILISLLQSFVLSIFVRP